MNSSDFFILICWFSFSVLFVAIPDFFASFSCMLTCWMSAPEGTYFSEAMCGFQSFYLTFGFTCNSWMNAAIVYQVHKLLRFSGGRRRYFPPTTREIFKQAGLIYVYAGIWALLAAFNFSGLPMESHAYYGYACFPMETADRATTFFFYLVFVPMIMFVPTTYVFGATLHIYWHGLLPPGGKTRKISFFLLRIVFVYLIVWAPFLGIAIIGNFVTIDSWVQFITSVTSHLQGLVTTVVVFYTNPQLRKSMNSVMRCDWKTIDFEEPEPDEENDGGSRWWEMGRRLRSSLKSWRASRRGSSSKLSSKRSHGENEETDNNTRPFSSEPPDDPPGNPDDREKSNASASERPPEISSSGAVDAPLSQGPKRSGTSSITWEDQGVVEQEKEAVDDDEVV